MKTVVILQPSYLPWIGYFDMMARSDIFVFYDDVQYDKHGWRNRNRIKSPKGEYQWVTVPVLNKGLQKPLINETQISNDSPWARKQIMSLKQNYSKAPFKNYLDELENIIMVPRNSLMELNLAVTCWLCDKFEIRTELFYSSKLGILGEQTERLVNICNTFGATHYLSGNAAQAYLDESQFKEKNIEVLWHNYQHPVYKQIYGDFLPYLSALDLLLNVGPESKNLFQQKSE